MEEKIKLYSKNSIILATYLGGPIAAGILIRKNSLNIGRKKEGSNALILGIVCTFLLFWGIYLIPEPILDLIPKALIPTVYSGIVYWIVEKLHGEILKKHKEEKNEFYSFWRATGIGTACLAIIIGGILAYVNLVQEDWEADTYATGINKFQINESEAMKLFEMLDNSSTFEIVQFIKQTGIPKWEENIEILNEIIKIENIPEYYQKQNKLLHEYCKLRIEAYELMSKAIRNNSSAYDAEIIRKHNRIDEIIAEL